MASEDERQELLAQLQKELDDFLETDPEELVRTEDLGKGLDFSSGRTAFERRLRLFRKLKDAGFSDLPRSTLNDIRNLVSQAHEQFKQIWYFSASGQNPRQERDHLIQYIKSHYDQEFRKLGPVIAYGQQTGANFEQMERRAREVLDQLTTLRKEASSQLEDVKKVAESVKRAAAEVGVSQHATHFQEEDYAQSKSSRRWLVAVGGTGILIVLLAFVNIWWLYGEVARQELDLGRAIQLSIGKLVLFSVLYFGLVWLARTYRSARHNQIVNRHRANALRTFETFVNAAADQQTKEAVLLRATDAIFGHQASGFDEARSELGSANVLEITRDLARGATRE